MNRLPLPDHELPETTNLAELTSTLTPEGIVRPGTEYEAITEQIAQDAPGLSEDEMAEVQEKLRGWVYAG